MDSANEIREFLMTRRARITPEQAGLPVFGYRQRRVNGLRREEVALLAGMSTEYYIRLERGNAKGVSESVLEGISQALKLDDAERAHLYDLVRAANEGTHTARRRSPARAPQVRPGVQRMIDAITALPTIVQSERLDLVASNQLGRAFYSEMYVQPQRPANFGRFIFLDPRSRDFYRDWDDTARQTVALLRSAAGRAPYDRNLSDLIGELATRSDDFRALWAAHDVRLHHSASKQVHHPIVGDLDLTFERLEIATDKGLSIIAYTAEPGSTSHDSLQLLAHWAATNNPITQHQKPETRSTTAPADNTERS
ncbi:transcriptional regulator with XRE-family HTH domain [Arthrobacter sp. V1I9]|jgi:transcriptional regulator with XRE-family HTH domain|uniref:helix-turn-helix transcriptional regulator n=1 Tax=Arthrobacter sp. V1I9 TaxID=3042275 RepID=UPI00278CBACE|nr:helix-turn-helix transcriptional regulator [Arthrobacter sp. V1I9]MDQ0867832.1 transcriptional regulator with XRE-family HTH domain [Arthrobacter sp. V1I9]